MTFDDIAHLNIPLPPRGSAERGTFRLLRDLVAVGVMQSDRPDAGDRLELLLGPGFARVVASSLTDGGRPHGLSPRRAA